LHTVDADVPPGISNQRCDPAVAIAAILGGQRYDRSGQRVFVCTDVCCVTLCPTWLADQPAGVTFRELILVPNPFDCLPAPFGAYKFPEAISFNTCFSRERSETNRLRRVFSFSKSFNRLACST
jgi:hypothetical protein